MPQLVLGAGNPIALGIEGGALVWLGSMPQLGESLMTRALLLGAAYFAYNAYIVPRFAPRGSSMMSVADAS